MKSLSFSMITCLSLCVLGGCAFQAAEAGDERLSTSSNALETENATQSEPSNPGQEREAEDPNMPGPTPWRNKTKKASVGLSQEVETSDDDGMPGPTPWQEKRVEVDPYL